jgi:hypothetical protein
MTESEGSPWRGYCPLLFALIAMQLAQQVDVVMIARAEEGGSGAYALLIRASFAEIVLMAAFGVVASTAVGRAQRDGNGARETSQILGLAALIGVLCGALGLWLYPRIATRLADVASVASHIREGAFWFSLSAPFRFLNCTSAFVLHAQGRHGFVLRWRLVELVAKFGGNLLTMNVLGFGFDGCFVTSATIAVGSCILCCFVFSSPQARWIAAPRYSLLRDVLRSTIAEAQRLLSMQLAALTALALFAAPWLGHYDVSRLDAFAAGQFLMLIVFAPLVALMQFLAVRFAALSEERQTTLLRTIWTQGLPLTIAAAVALYSTRDWLGHLYGRQGPWWSVLVEAMAISLPLRLVSNVRRATFQARGAFKEVATADGFAFWLLMIPLTAIGLHLDSPSVAYLSLIAPEAFCVIWLGMRLRILLRPVRVRMRPNIALDRSTVVEPVK